MPVALNDAVSAGDFPGMLLDSREGIYVASLFVAALVPFVRRAFVELVAEVREGRQRERERDRESEGEDSKEVDWLTGDRLTFSLPFFSADLLDVETLLPLVLSKPSSTPSPPPSASFQDTSPSAGLPQDSPSFQSGKVGAFWFRWTNKAMTRKNRERGLEGALHCQPPLSLSLSLFRARASLEFSLRFSP